MAETTTITRPAPIIEGSLTAFLKSIDKLGPPFIIKDDIPAIINTSESTVVIFCFFIKFILVFDKMRI